MKKHCLTADFTCFLNRVEKEPSHGRSRYTGHFSSQNLGRASNSLISSTQTNTQFSASDSAIGLYLFQHPICAQHYDDSRFSLLAQGRTPFHPLALEATFIKTSNPALCRQKRIRVQLNDCALITLSHCFFFPANHDSSFSYK